MIAELRRLFAAAVALSMTIGTAAAQSRAPRPPDVSQAALEAPAGTQRMIVLLYEAFTQALRVPADADVLARFRTDGRLDANPQYFAHVARGTLASIGLLEDELDMKAKQAFGTAVHGFVAYLTPAQVQRLQADARVAAVLEDTLGRTATVNVPNGIPITPNTTPLWADNPAVTGSSLYTHTWGLQAMEAPATSSSGLRVPNGLNTYLKAYVVDDGVWGGVDRNNWHPELNLVQRVSFRTSAVGSMCRDHATHVAGIIGAKDDVLLGSAGVAPGAPIVSVEVISYCGSNNEGLAWNGDLITALDWINAQQGTYNPQQRRPISAVANISIVWSSYSTTPPFNARDILAWTLHKTAWNGVLITAAGGNSNENACNIWPAAGGSSDTTTFVDPHGPPPYPAPLDNGIIAVGAMRSDGRMMQESEQKIAATGPCVELWAPGERIWSTTTLDPDLVGPFFTPAGWPSYFRYRRETGSSMAAPQVAGAALLMARRMPTATTDVIETQLKATSKTKFTGYTEAGQHGGTAIRIPKLSAY